MYWICIWSICLDIIALDICSHWGEIGSHWGVRGCIGEYGLAGRIWPIQQYACPSIHKCICNYIFVSLWSNFLSISNLDIFQFQLNFSWFLKNPYCPQKEFFQNCISPFQKCICFNLKAVSLFVFWKYILENMVYGFGCGLSSNKYACSSIHCEHTILNVSAIYQSLLHCIAMRQNAKAIIHLFPLE